MDIWRPDEIQRHIDTVKARIEAVAPADLCSLLPHEGKATQNMRSAAAEAGFADEFQQWERALERLSQLPPG
jgi:uncharacterized protein YukE